jgi:hypothetical protein
VLGPARHLPIEIHKLDKLEPVMLARNGDARIGNEGESDMSTPMEYLPLIIYAVTFFIMPTVGAIVFWWFWRHERARVQSRYRERMRETRRQPRAERAHDEYWRAF